jgi:hypothetical protein
MELARILSPLYHPLARRAWRVGRAATIGLAALYAAMVAIHAANYTGSGFSAVVFALQTLKADTNDMAATLFRQAGLAEITSAGRPLNYVLLCAPIDGGKTGNPPAVERLADTQASVVQQLTTHSGPVYNLVRGFIDRGQNQLMILLRPGDTNAAVVRGYFDPKERTCLADKDNPAQEAGRVPASVIFAPDKEIKFQKAH